MARPLWKGAISFGLVTIPVSVYSATRTDALRFRQLDRRDNSPIREKRVNEETGDEVAWEDVVKGYEYEEGSFVILDQDDFTKANVKATRDDRHRAGGARGRRTAASTSRSRCTWCPPRQGVKAYHILRETLRRTGRVGSRHHRHARPAAPGGADRRRAGASPSSCSATPTRSRRWRSSGADDLLEAPDVKDKEIELAEQLVAALDEPWAPGPVPRRVPRRPARADRAEGQDGHRAGQARRRRPAARRRGRRHDGAPQEERRGGQGAQGREGPAPQGELIRDGRAAHVPAQARLQQDG